MPNPYHYFESGEVSHERLVLEIELLKQLQDMNLLRNLDWNAYDTSALKLFQQAGIREASDALSQRLGNHSNECEQTDFIEACVRKHQASIRKENFQEQRMSFPLILNAIVILICLCCVMGLFIYQYVKFNHQHHLFQSLDRPLTTKRRHLSFTDDLPMILLTFTCAIIFGSTVLATRFSWKMILFELFALLIVIIFLILKVYQIISFLSRYQELRWPMLYDYMYS